jgi:hypothetical protein
MVAIRTVRGNAGRMTKLNGVAMELNERPRKTPTFETPARRLNQSIHRPVEFTQKRAS